MTDKPRTLTPERQEAVKRSMSRAGIAQRYHGPENSIMNFGKPGQFVNSLMDNRAEFLSFIRCGKGFCIRGNNAMKSYDFAVTLARAMRIDMIDVRVVNLISISQNLSVEFEEERDTRFQNFDVVRGLVITRFVEPMDTLPMKRSEFYKMESWLYGLMEEGISLTVQYSGNLEKSGWWSDYFIDRLKANNTEIVI